MLEQLIALYRHLGGLCGYSVDCRSNSLPAEARPLHRRLHSKLCATIKDGPVFYAGGGGSRTFVYDKLTRCVLMDADLWRELSVMGNWIADATVLRWAELTAEISQGRLRPSQVIDQLLTVPIPEREVQAARSLYEGLPGKVCVWTDQELRGGFDVDHAIPFALWRNNDLWNLLPASPAANHEKRDRLPSRSLVLARKDCIIHYWSLMRQRHPVRFAFEVGKLAGPDVARADHWENRLFSTVAEAVEFTAIQRGVERWQPTAFVWVPSSVRQTPAQSAAGSPIPTEPEAAAANVIVYDPPPEERFVHCIPFYDVAAAAGAFGPDQPAVDPAEHHSWIRVKNLRLTEDMFAIRVEGRSMEPKIPHGSICLFRGGDALAGTRQGRVVLVALRDSVDPETGGRLTVKRYSSEKVFDVDAVFTHSRITLKPLNAEYASIVLEQVEEGTLTVLGEFVRVL
jgi:SOS-response transcriptional repressor LexA